MHRYSWLALVVFVLSISGCIEITKIIEIIESSSSSTSSTASKYLLSWQVSPDAAVNRAGGGYRIYSSRDNYSQPILDIAFNGVVTPTQAKMSLEKGKTYNLKIKSYSALNASGSELSAAISIAVN